MKTAQGRECLERLLYNLVTAQVAEQLSLIKNLKRDSQAMYSLVVEEFQRLTASLERRQNRERRKHLVVTFASIAGIKTLLEEHYPHLQG